MRILVLRQQEPWVCELLTNRHHRSCNCATPAHFWIATLTYPYSYRQV